MSGRIVPLHRRGPPAPPHEAGRREFATALRSMEQSARLIVSDAEAMIGNLEAQLSRVQDQIAVIADAETSERLAREHAVISAALRQAKSEVASLGAACETDGERSSSLEVR